MPKNKKKELRKNLLEQREKHDLVSKQEFSTHIFTNFFENVAVKKDLTIAGYYPVKGEVDVMPILKELLKIECNVVLPRVNDKESPLSFLRWDEDVPMKEGLLGILEPLDGKNYVPDIIIAPLVAFDPRGYRLGYGSGLYDRTLEQMNLYHPVFTVGVGYEFQKCDEIPIEDIDMPMDMIVTEEKVYI